MSIISQLVNSYVAQWQSNIQSKFGMFYTQKARIYNILNGINALKTSPATIALTAEYTNRYNNLLTNNGIIEKNVNNITNQLKTVGDTILGDIKTFSFSINKIFNLGISATTALAEITVNLPSVFNQIDEHIALITALESDIKNKASENNINISLIGSEALNLLSKYGIFIAGGIGIIIYMLMKKKNG